MENSLVAISNMPALYPILISYKNNDRITFTCILFLASASFISHLFENHKHGMHGMNFIKYLNISSTTSYILNRFDVIGCIIVLIRFIYLYHSRYGYNLNLITKNGLYFGALICSFGLNLLSEYDKYNPKLKYMYIVTHSIWHICIFYLMGQFLSKFIYN
jgi:hypothetical protein